MSLKRIIKEFQDKDIPIRIAKAVSKFDSVGSIELADDYPIGAVSSEAYVYTVKTKSGDDRILRISRSPADQRFFYDLFSEFQEGEYDNIVDVYFSGEVKDYDVTVMEKLERSLRTGDEIEAFVDVTDLLYLTSSEWTSKILKMGIVEYAYSDKTYDTVTGGTDPEKLKRAIIANIAVGGQKEKLTRDLSNALQEYYNVTGEQYDDLHEENVMVSKDGTYKLIDL